ncbi:enoyl-CoA delta isomerase 2 [Aureococcus anophagefferens]|uniref:Enoyl-CoA delta isomerase 2 n=1 Tax=Aureococcus anophagefferens TaxID=44056 RepID=A0ABR1FH31_AURAN
MIYRSNKKVFDTFLDFPKPLCVAVNGPNIGAAVTTATLADGVVASERATFSTPFATGRDAEGCSSAHRGFADTAALKAVNERESRDLADAFLSTKFLRAQADLSSKGKTRPALAFKVLIATRPAWSLLLP